MSDDIDISQAELDQLKLRIANRALRKEVKRFRALAETLVNIDHYSCECTCKGCKAQREVRLIIDKRQRAHHRFVSRNNR